MEGNGGKEIERDLLCVAHPAFSWQDERFDTMGAEYGMWAESEEGIAANSRFRKQKPQRGRQKSEEQHSREAAVNGLLPSLLIHLLAFSISSQQNGNTTGSVLIMPGASDEP